MSTFEYKKYEYYCIIALISAIAVFFLPMLGSEAGLGWVLPDTFAGWVVYIITKLLVAVINALLFYCFMEQAKINVKDNPRYIEANEILRRCGVLADVIYRGPDEWERHEYRTKGTTIAITTTLSAIGLTQAVLSWDLASMLTYLLTIVMGVIFGIVQCHKAETYWTEEYWLYAKKIEREMLDKKEVTS